MTAARVPHEVVVKGREVGFIGDLRGEGVWCEINVRGDRAIGRLESQYLASPRDVLRVDGRWNGRCEYLILSPSKGENRIKKTRYTIVNKDELLPMPHIQVDGDRIGYRWRRTGHIVFPAFDIRNINELGNRPLWIVGNNTTCPQVTAEPALVEFLGTLDESDPFDSTLVKKGKLRWIPIDPKRFTIGIFNQHGRFVGRYEELSPWQILNLPDRAKDEATVAEAYQKGMQWLDENFSDDVLRPFKSSIAAMGPNHYKELLKAAEHNARQLQIALGLSQVLVRKRRALDASSQKGAASLFGHHRALPSTTAKPEASKALVVPIGETGNNWQSKLALILNLWTAVLRTALLEPNPQQVTENDIATWASSLRSVTTGEPKALNPDDVVVLSLFAKAELPDQWRKPLLRHIRVEVQGANPDDYAEGTVSLVRVDIDMPLGQSISSNAVEAWQELLTSNGIGDRRQRLILATALASQFYDNGPDHAKSMDDSEVRNWLGAAYQSIRLPFSDNMATQLITAINRYTPTSEEPEE